MNNFNISAITLALGLAFSVAAMAEDMSKELYKSQDENIGAEYKVAKAACNSFAGNTRDICVAEAKGKKSIAKAELEENYKPSVKTRYQAYVAKADADYAVAIEKCDEKGGNDKDVCVKEAKAVKVHTMADAKAQMSTSKVNAVANEKSIEAQSKAMEKATDARQDATLEKRAADYAVAKEKCEVLAGNAKGLCISDAKVRYGQ